MPQPIRIILTTLAGIAALAQFLGRTQDGVEGVKTGWKALQSMPNAATVEHYFPLLVALVCLAVATSDWWWPWISRDEKASTSRGKETGETASVRAPTPLRDQPNLTTYEVETKLATIDEALRLIRDELDDLLSPTQGIITAQREQDLHKAPETFTAFQGRIAEFHKPFRNFRLKLRKFIEKNKQFPDVVELCMEQKFDFNELDQRIIQYTQFAKTLSENMKADTKPPAISNLYASSRTNVYNAANKIHSHQKNVSDALMTLHRDTQDRK